MSFIESIVIREYLTYRMNAIPWRTRVNMGFWEVIHILLRALELQEEEGFGLRREWRGLTGCVRCKGGTQAWNDLTDAGREIHLNEANPASVKPLGMKRAEYFKERFRLNEKEGLCRSERLTRPGWKVGWSRTRNNQLEDSHCLLGVILGTCVPLCPTLWLRVITYVRRGAALGIWMGALFHPYGQSRWNAKG